jgi:hypothetical protein
MRRFDHSTRLAGKILVIERLSKPTFTTLNRNTLDCIAPPPDRASRHAQTSFATDGFAP